MKKKKAQAFTWLYIMVMIFAMGLIYIMMNQAYDKVSSNLGGNFTGSEYEPTYTKMQSLWDMFLLVFLIGALIYGILTTMRKPDEY